MGSSQTKEEVVIAQRRANLADLQLLHRNDSNTNIILGVILIILSIGMTAACYKLYKKCHIEWMRQEIARGAFIHSGGR